MEKEELKRHLLERINQIESVTKLNAIHAILNTLDKEVYNKDAAESQLEPEDYSGYIKEWIKSM
ncbi:MAG: hypothetical protein CR989_00285 [Flavobacteriales bacterium]|nr:MAG: hypothetical protein CR989_00285 [Flavobacteriales bacterium]